MPYLKQRDPPFIDLSRLLKGYDLGTGTALAVVLGVSESTALRRLQHPERLTLADLSKIVRHGHIPAETLRESIKL